MSIQPFETRRRAAGTQRRSRRQRPLSVAIVGIGCRFPGAPDLLTFWKNVVAGRDCTTDVPADRWDPAVFCDPTSTANDRVYCRRGGYLDAPIGFDPSRHGVMPLAVEGGEPEQFLVLDAARAALDDAGLTGGIAKGLRAEVVIGRGNYFNRGNLTRLQHGRIVAQTVAILRSIHPDWSDDDFEAVRADLKASLPPFEAGTVAGQLTNATAGRIADRLDLSGASYVVDAASASSLVALDLGTRALVEGRADIALVGGVYIASDVDFPLVFSRLGALSRRGESRPFAQSADGTLPGEGVGVVVLKRLADAERDGDRVYAVVQGVGLSSDGKGAGLAAPSATGHYRAIKRAYRQSGIDPATIEMIEGHGLGVPAADLAELKALNAVFPTPERGKRAIGAVSSLIGHAMPAAGMAGLIKTALSLHHRLLPPSPYADEPHPLLGGDHPFAMNAECRPWLHGETAYPRRAGVNAFGFAGVNSHAILEEHSRSADGDTPGCMPDWESEAILLGAPDRARWVEVARALLGWLETGANASVPLKDLAFTLNTGQRPFPFRVGFVTASASDFRKRLSAAIDRIGDPKCKSMRDASGTYFWEEPLAGPGRLAFLYPGEGSQYPGMLADLCPHFPELRGALDTADRVAIRFGHGLMPSEQLFAKVEGEGLWRIETAVNVVLSSQWALHLLLAKLGLKPDAVVGHSSGEFLALAAARAIPFDQDLEVKLGQLGSVFERLEKSGKVPTATLIAVAADRAKVETLCREAGVEITVAIDNCPHQVVIAGPSHDMAKAVETFRSKGVLCEELPFHRAYHTPAFASALEPIRSFFAAMPLRPPELALYSCATAKRVDGGVEEVRRLAVEQWVSTVDFRKAIETMHADGVRLFVDVGARGNLSGFVEDGLRGKPHFAVAANLPRRSGVTQLNHLVAALYAQGVELRPDHLYARRRPVSIDLGSDWQTPKVAPPLAVGFPEMSLSRGLARSLQEKTRSVARDEAVGPVETPSPPRRIDLPNGHADEFHQEHHHAGHAMPSLTVETNGHLVTKTGRPSTNGHAAHAPAASYTAPAPATPAPAHPNALLAYFETMDEFLETQRQVMEAYLQGRGTATAVVHAPAVNGHAPAPVLTPEPSPVVIVPVEPVQKTVEGVSGIGGTPSGSPLVRGRVLVEEVPAEMAAPALDVRAVLLDQVHKRTGYPVEMLGLDLDMEADLGIDSIKRVEIFGELQSAGVVPDGMDLETLSRCRSLGQLVEVLTRDREKAEPKRAKKVDLSWLGEIKSFDEGREVVAHRSLDVRADPVASHHTLGGRHVSEIDTDRLGYPVLPFTVMAELLAQAASAVIPDRVVIGLRDIQANRWMAYEKEPIVLELHAVRDPKKPDEVHCTIRNLGSTRKRRGGHEDPHVQGVVIFGSSRPARPRAAPFAVKEAGVCRFTADELYRDQWLFHGPALQALTHVGPASPHGIEGTLRVLPLRDLFPKATFPTVHTDPIVLDNFTHLLGGWGLDKQAGEEGDVMFPLRLGELSLFGDEPAAGTEFSCRITIREITRHRVHAEAEIVDAEGRVWMRLKDWFDWRFYWPGQYRDVFRQPKTVLLGEPVDETASSVAVWLEPPVDMGKPVWRDVLEWVQFSPSEREANRVLGDAEPALSLRIWGRIATKEVARRLWLSRGGSPRYPADLVLETGPDGVSRVRPLVNAEGVDVPVVAVAEAEGVVAAVGSLDPSARVGVAVARLGSPLTGNLGDEEAGWLDLNTTPGPDRDEWTARFATARKAVADAFSKTTTVADVDRVSGEMFLRIEGETGGVKARTGRRGDGVWAVTTGERVVQ